MARRKDNGMGMAAQGSKLAAVIEEMAAMLEAAGEHARAASLRGDVNELRGDDMLARRRLDILRIERISSGLAWLAARAPRTSGAERLRLRLRDAIDGAA